MLGGVFAMGWNDDFQDKEGAGPLQFFVVCL